MSGDETWIVGLDLQPTGRGAVEFAAGLAGGAGARLVGVHVLEEAFLRSALKYHHLDELDRAAREAASGEIAAADAENHFGSVEIVQGATAEKHLADAVAKHGARGLIIGRQARKEGRHLLRLGRVARRVLRMLPCPTIVVPPDWQPDSGPVISASNLRGDCAEATRFAKELAARLGRDLVIVHVVPMPEDHAAGYLPLSTLDKLRKENVVEGTRALEQWAEEHGFGGTECVLEQGGVGERVVAIAKERGASMVCTGSRRLSGFDRMLLTSVGSEIAASASCPVAVVPPIASEVD